MKRRRPGPIDGWLDTWARATKHRMPITVTVTVDERVPAVFGGRWRTKATGIAYTASGDYSAIPVLDAERHWGDMATLKEVDQTAHAVEFHYGGDARRQRRAGEKRKASNNKPVDEASMAVKAVVDKALVALRCSCVADMLAVYPRQKHDVLRTYADPVAKRRVSLWIAENGEELAKTLGVPWP